MFPKERAHHFHISVTHKEVVKGLLDVSPSGREKVCVVFDRRLSGVDSKPNAAFIDCKAGAVVDDGAQNLLESLRTQIKG